MAIIPEQTKHCKICRVEIPACQEYCREHSLMILEREKDKKLKGGKVENGR